MAWVCFLLYHVTAVCINPSIPNKTSIQSTTDMQRLYIYQHHFTLHHLAVQLARFGVVLALRAPPSLLTCLLLLSRDITYQWSHSHLVLLYTTWQVKMMLLTANST